MSGGIPMERMTPEEIARLKLRCTNRDGSAEVLCSKAWAHITLQGAEIEKLRADIAYADTHAAKVESLLWGTARENERLRAALCPLAGVFLYPDDLGFEASSDIKEDLDWDDDANDMNTENVFVLRRDIRRARAVLSASQPAQEAPAP